MHDLYILLQEAPEMYLSKIQDWITLSHKVHISKTALHENICNTGLSSKLFCRAVGEHNEDFWVEWKQDINAHFTTSQMIFVDKTSKDNQTIYWHYRCSVARHYASINANFVWGDRFSMVAALSLDWYEAVHVFPGSVDREGFLDFIVNNMVHCTVHSTLLNFY